MPPHPAVGIDFGTTNSSVAVATPTGVRLATFANDSPSSRSILYLEKSAQGILSTTGPEAIARYLIAHRDAEAPGRLIQSLKSYLPSRTLTATEVFSRRYTLEDLISRILGDLRERAGRYFGLDIRHATIGRPVRFLGAETDEDDAFALGRLRAACTQAGFQSVEFALEPLGAAAAFERTLAPAEQPRVVLIGDFGGGTSDFSLLRLSPAGGREVLAVAGLPFAGDAFDARIVRSLVAPALGSRSLQRGSKAIPAVPAWVYANLERWHYLSFLRTRNALEILSTAQRRAEQPDQVAALRALIDEDLGYQLHQAVQRTKTALSNQAEAVFSFTGPEAGSLAFNEPPLRATVLRAAFEEWIEPELTQIATAVDDLLTAARLDSAAVTHVFLTGGSSFVPAVRQIFEARFPSRVQTGGEFTSVAQGLALLDEERALDNAEQG